MSAIGVPVMARRAQVNLPESGYHLARAPLISIVEDDESVRQAMAALLESLEYDCRCFESATAFLADFRPGAFSCLLSDVRMPGMSGLELQQRLRELDPELPVILMTSVEDETVRQRALAAGAAALLYKPIATGTLIDLFETVLCRQG